MNHAPRNRLSRRALLAGAAAGLAIAAPAFRGPAISLAQTPASDLATPVAPPTTLEEVLSAGLASGLSGVTLRAEQNGSVIFDGAAGFASLEEQTRLRPADQIRIASVTKTFTAILILQLLEAGALTLDDTVPQWVDDPVAARIPHVEQMTLRQLLNHTAGVYDYFDGDSAFWQDAYFGPEADWERVWTPQELLAYADGDTHAPYFAPGEGFHYSNAGYILLGLVLEQAGGQQYAEQLRTRILDPAGLDATSFGATEPLPAGMVDSYHVVEGTLNNVSTIHLSALGTGGGMVSTTQDLSRFAVALFGGELLKPETFELMLDAVPTVWPGVEWGLGVMRVETPGGELIGHEGDGPGAGARLFRHPEADLTIALLTNTGGADEIVRRVFTQAVELLLDMVS